MTDYPLVTMTMAQYSELIMQSFAYKRTKVLLEEKESFENDGLLLAELYKIYNETAEMAAEEKVFTIAVYPETDYIEKRNDKRGGWDGMYTVPAMLTLKEGDVIRVNLNNQKHEGPPYIVKSASEYSPSAVLIHYIVGT